MIRFRLGFESFSVATLTLTHGGQSETTGGVFRKDAEGLLLRFMPDSNGLLANAAFCALKRIYLRFASSILETNPSMSPSLRLNGVAI